MKRAAFLFIAVLLCLAPAAAPAQMTPPNAVTLKAGVYVPQADADDAEFDSGFNGEISFTRYFHPNFAFELGVGYFQSETDFNDELTVIPITLNVKGVYPMGGVELYALAGLGAYLADIELGAPFNVDDDDTTIGFQLGIGANFNITPVVFIGAEGKYFWAEPEFFGADFKIDGFQATANLGYRF